MKQTKESTSSAQGKLMHIEKISVLLDSKFRLPGTNFRFGLDPILGLIPGLGDIGSFAISAALLYTLAKHGASRKVVILMLLNILADAVFGIIPLAGNVFDFFFKANVRNIKILRKHYEEGKYQGSGTGILILLVVALLILFAALIFGLFKLGQYIVSWFH